MKTLTTYIPAQIAELTLKEITAINNTFAEAIGTKTTKRFGTKPAAIKKCFDNQGKYNHLLKEYSADQRVEVAEALKAEAAKDPVQKFIDNGGEITQCPSPKDPKQPVPTSKSAGMSTRKPKPAKADKPAKAAKAEGTTTEQPKVAKTPANSFAMTVAGKRETYDIATTVVTVVKHTEKSDTIVAVLINAVEASLEATVEEVAEQVIASYNRPKSAKQVDRSFVIRKLKRAIAKGFLKLVQA